MKTLRKILLWSLPFLAILVVFLLAPSQDRSATIIEITNVSSEQVAAALREESTVIQSGLFGSGPVHVWPSVESANRPKAVFRYKLNHFLFGATEGIDTVGVTTKEPNSVVVSLRCVQKREFFRMVRFTYKRRTDREHKILTGAMRRLRESAAGAGKTITARGLSGWDPNSGKGK